MWARLASGVLYDIFVFSETFSPLLGAHLASEVFCDIFVFSETSRPLLGAHLASGVLYDIFVFSETFRPLLGAHLTSGVLLPGLKPSWRDVTHSPPSCAKVKNEWMYTFIPPICLYVLDREYHLFLYFCGYLRRRKIENYPVTLHRRYL